LQGLLPQLRNMFYLEVNQERQSDLMRIYLDTAQEHPGLLTARASKAEDIYPLFRTLFRRTRGGAS